jgi:hypothetical protein
MARVGPQREKKMDNIAFVSILFREIQLFSTIILVSLRNPLSVPTYKHHSFMLMFV